MPSLPWHLLDRHFAPVPNAVQAGWLTQHEFAHRGLHDSRTAENSPTAFARAIEGGLGIECDLRPSREGRAIVFHDAETERLTGRPGRLGELGVGEVARLRLRPGDDPVQTLRDLLRQVAGDAPLLLELKVDGGRSVSPLCRAVRRDLEGYAGPVAVMSFDWRVSRWFARKAPGILRGLVVSEEGRRTLSAAMRRRIAFWKARPQFLAYDIRDLPSTFPAGQRKRGLPVLSWTVSSAVLSERAQMHADAAIAEGSGLALAARTH